MEQQTTPSTAPIEQMLEKLGVEAVFGKPTSEGEVTIIPVAQVELGFGYGSGYGRGARSEQNNGAETATPEQEGEGGGGGGGAGGRAIPRGYVRITSQEVKFQPIIDETRIPLAGILMVAWSVFWVAATVRSVVKSLARRKRKGS
jgi:uncharacterized spore protein YtfJ